MSKLVNIPEMIPGTVKVPGIIHRFVFTREEQKEIREQKYSFGFNGFGEAVYYRTYSRQTPEGQQERWPDTVIRVVQGNISIRKNYCLTHGLEWSSKKWHQIAFNMAIKMMKMEFLPPGRGLFMSGTEYMYSRGAASLNNCGFISTREGLVESMSWLMDMLMCGCGIGFDTDFKGSVLPPKRTDDIFRVPDSREGWVLALRQVLNAYIPDKNNKRCSLPSFDFSLIREAGKPLKGFGGTSSGSDPLIKLLHRVECFLNCYLQCQNKIDEYQDLNIDCRDKIILLVESLNESDKKTVIEKIQKVKGIKTYGLTRLIVDIANAIGACVVAGNIRRSSEIACGSADDPEFKSLKDYKLNPERSSIGWMSNNTIKLDKNEDFKHLGSIVERIVDNGEPGIVNMINVRRCGRVGRTGRPNGREGQTDTATGLNPCGEIALESGELCNICEIFLPKHLTLNGGLTAGKEEKVSKSFNTEKFLETCRLATLYVSNVSLLPTHWSRTNQVIGRNRRIGVGIGGIAGLYDNMNTHVLIAALKKGYQIVRETNRKYNSIAGVPESIRVTTVKPSGSISQLAGVSSGIHFNLFRYAIRRMRVSNTDAKLLPVLKKAGYFTEPDTYSDNTTVVEFPIDFGSPRVESQVSMWEQLGLGRIIQNVWSDNCISQTIHFDPEKESGTLEQAITQTIPFVKTISVLPHTKKGSYTQMPYEGISKEKYQSQINKILPIDWDNFEGSDGQKPIGCTSERCMLPD